MGKLGNARDGTKVAVEQADTSYVEKNLDSLEGYASDLFSWGKGFVKTVGQGIKTGAKYIQSEIFTNEDKERGINDFDAWQGYNKRIKELSTTDDERQQIYKKMSDDGIIDINTYADYYEGRMEEQAKNVDLEREEIDSHLNGFKESLADSIKDSVSSATTRYQQEVLTKSVEELMKDYSYTYENVMATYKDTGDENLLKKREKVEKEYQDLIINKEQEFAKDIVAGTSYQDAYHNLIKTDKEGANRLVNIQNDLTIQGYKTALKRDWNGFVGSIKGENSVDGFANGVRGILDIISGAVGMVGIGLEEGKQALGYYDTLEELSNLNVYKEGTSSFKRGVGNVGAFAFEMFDAIPNIVPEVATFILGNKATGGLKIERALTKIMKAKSLKGIAMSDIKGVSRGATFLKDMVTDTFVLDAVFQPAMGRPMTEEDFKMNMMFNIPINGALAMLGKGTKLLGAATPDSALRNNFISKDLLDYIKNGGGGPGDNGIVAFADANILPKRTIDVSALESKELIAKIKKAQDEGIALRDRLKSGNATLKDITAGMEASKLKATKGKNINSYYNEILGDMPDKVKYNVITDKVGTMEKLLSSSNSGIGTFVPKTQHNLILRLLGDGKLDTKKVLNVIKKSGTNSVEGNKAKEIITAIIESDGERLGKVVESVTGSESPTAIQAEMKKIYDTITNKVIIKDADKVLEKGDVVGKYIYDGEAFTDIFSKQKLSKKRMVETFENNNRNETEDSIGLMLDKADELEAMSAGMKQKGTTDITKIIDIKYPLKRGDGTYGVMKNTIEKLGLKINIDEITKEVVIKGGRNELANFKTGLESLANRKSNFSELTEYEMGLIDFIYHEDLLNAYRNADALYRVNNDGKYLKANDFKTWFEQQYVLEEGVHKLKLTYLNTKLIEQQMKSMVAEGVAYPVIEEMAASNIVANTVKKFALEYKGKLTSKETFSTIKKGIRYNFEQINKIPEELLDIISNDVHALSLNPDVKMMNDYISIISGPLGNLLSDPMSIKNLKGMNTSDVYKDILGRLLFKDKGQGGRFLDIMVANLKTNKKQIKVNGLIKEIEDLASMDRLMGGAPEPFKIATKINKLKVFKKYSVINNVSDLYRFEQRTDIATSYLKKFGDNTEVIAETSMTDLDKIVGHTTRTALESVGLKSDYLSKKLADRMNTSLQQIKTIAPESKVKIINGELYIISNGGVQINANLFTKMKVENALKRVSDKKIGPNTVKKIKETIADMGNLETKEAKAEAKNIIDTLLFNGQPLEIPKVLTNESKLIDFLYNDMGKRIEKDMTLGYTNVGKVLDDIDDLIITQETAHSIGKGTEDLEALYKGREVYALYQDIILNGKTLDKETFEKVLKTRLSPIDMTPKTYMVNKTPAPLKKESQLLFNNQFSKTETPDDLMKTTSQVYNLIQKRVIGEGQITTKRAFDLLATKVDARAERFGDAVQTLIGKDANIELADMLIGDEMNILFKAYPDVDKNMVIISNMVGNILRKYGNYAVGTMKHINELNNVPIQYSMLKSLKTDAGRDGLIKDILIRYGADLAEGGKSVDQVLKDIPVADRQEIADTLYHMFEINMVNPIVQTKEASAMKASILGNKIADMMEGQYVKMKGSVTPEMAEALDSQMSIGDFSILREDLNVSADGLMMELYGSEMKKHSLIEDNMGILVTRPNKNLAYNLSALIDAKGGVQNPKLMSIINGRPSSNKGKTVLNDMKGWIKHKDTLSNFGLLREMGYSKAMKEYPEVFKGKVKVKLYSAKLDKKGAIKEVEYELGKVNHAVLFAHTIKNFAEDGRKGYKIMIDGKQQVVTNRYFWNTTLGKYIKEGYQIGDDITNPTEIIQGIKDNIANKGILHTKKGHIYESTIVDEYIKKTLQQTKPSTDYLNAVMSNSKVVNHEGLNVVAYSPRFSLIDESKYIGDPMSESTKTVSDKSLWVYDEESYNATKRNIGRMQMEGEGFGQHLEIENFGDQLIKMVDKDGKETYALAFHGESRGKGVEGERTIKKKIGDISKWKDTTTNTIKDITPNKNISIPNNTKINIKKMERYIIDETGC